MNNEIFNNGITSATSSLYYPNITYTLSAPSEQGVQGSLKLERKNQEISPKLYVSYVKSKLNKLQKEKLKNRISKLQKLVSNAKDLNQVAYYEELSRLLAVTIRESEILAVGVEKWVTSEVIEKFRNSVKDKVIKLNIWEAFPRDVPTNIRKIIKMHQTVKVFDELWVLYIDYTKQDMKTHEDKVKEKVAREKDPILFGKFSYLPNNYYFIADWIDEYCNLTLDKFVEAIRVTDPGYALTEIPEVGEDWFEAIKAEVKKRHEELNPPRRTLALNNGTVKPIEGIKPEAKKLWWKFWS